MSRIEDYALIGDSRSAALVSNEGSLDWLCWPRFDSPSLFGRLLDGDGGHWMVAPLDVVKSERSYIEDTNVLETRFHTTGGTLLLVDLMPVVSERARGRQLLPEHEVLRIAKCEAGEVELELEFAPRPDYGAASVHLREAGALGVRLECPQGLLTLRTDMPCRVDDGTVRGRVRLREGDARHFSLTLAVDGPGVFPPLGEESAASLQRTVDWWRRWARQIEYQGPYRNAVVRSALALRAMVFAPSGAIVAAPTTSLPERIGGDLNWDYRYCWLRDAAFTVRALFGLGLHDEAHAFLSWSLHTTRLTRPAVNILYDLFGRPPRSEEVLQDWKGYQSSRPVRIGNAASEQVQLDVYGELADAVAIFERAGGEVDHETQKLLCDLGEYVCRHWPDADEGIWEPRSGKAHRTHSRVLCWVALDRLIALNSRGQLRCRHIEMFRRNRELIRSQVHKRAWNPDLRSYVSVLDGNELDASLLLLSWYGFEEAASERMRATWSRVSKTLGAGNGLLYRYRTGETPGEGAFGICSFWNAEYLAHGGGSLDAAEAMFQSLLTYANDVGLYAEEIDPDTGAPLGNFPQAFTHVGLINAALSIEERRNRSERRPPEPSKEIRV